MRFLRSAAATFALAASVFALPAATASRFSPAAPLPFELVNLRTTVDSCAFNPATVFVANTGTAIQVRMRDNQCFAPGTPVDVELRLGAFPTGLYNVEVTNGDGSSVRERLQFSVVPRAEIAVFPPIPHPNTDYSGVWWNPQESGWGLSITQSARDTVFAALFVYDAQNRPQWFTFQPGGWTSATRWTGTVYRTTGPYFAAPGYDPSLVGVQAVGSAIIEFEAAPGGGSRGRFEYTIDGAGTVVKTLVRMPL